MSQQRRVILIGNLRHTVSRVESNIVRIALERYVRTSRDPFFRRTGLELLKLWKMGDAPAPPHAQPDTNRDNPACAPPAEMLSGAPSGGSTG